MILGKILFLVVILSANIVFANPVSIGPENKWVMTHESVTIECLKRNPQISGEYYFKEIKLRLYEVPASHISLRMPVLLETWFVKREEANTRRVLNIHDINNRLKINVNGYENAATYTANDSRMNKMFSSINMSDYETVWASLRWGVVPEKNRPLTIEYFRPFYKPGERDMHFIR